VVPSLKLTAKAPEKMDGWNMMNFPFGLAYFGRCELVVSGSAKGLLRLFFFGRKTSHVAEQN